MYRKNTCEIAKNNKEKILNLSQATKNIKTCVMVIYVIVIELSVSMKDDRAMATKLSQGNRIVP